MNFDNYQNYIIDSDVTKVENEGIGIISTECSKITDSIKHVLLYALKFESLIEEENEGRLKFLINSLANG